MFTLGSTLMVSYEGYAEAINYRLSIISDIWATALSKLASAIGSNELTKRVA